MIQRIVYPLWGNKNADELKTSVHSFSTIGFSKSRFVFLQLGELDQSKFIDGEWIDARQAVAQIPEEASKRTTTDIWRKLAIWSVPEIDDWTLFLDTDTIAVKSCEELHKVECFAACENWSPNSYQFPIPLAGPYQSINSGVMVAKPTQKIWQKILEWCYETLPNLPKGKLGRGDECLVNYMRQFNIMPDWSLLHRRYNTTYGHIKLYQESSICKDTADPIILHCNHEMAEEVKQGIILTKYHKLYMQAMLAAGIKIKEPLKSEFRCNSESF